MAFEIVATRQNLRQRRRDAHVTPGEDKKLTNLECGVWKCGAYETVSGCTKTGIVHGSLVGQTFISSEFLLQF